MIKIHLSVTNYHDKFQVDRSLSNQIVDQSVIKNIPET